MDPSSGSMDPMKVLPQELIVHICSFLPIDGLLRLWEVNHSWRQIVADHSLWRDYELEVLGFVSESDMPAVAHSLRVLRRAPCIGCICFNGTRGLNLKLQQALLETNAVVLRIDYLTYSEEIEDWVVPFIRHIGPRLEAIQVYGPSITMLHTLITLPRLTKLHVINGRSHCGDDPAVQTSVRIGQLKLFEDQGEPTWTLQPNWLLMVLKIHHLTLEEIRLAAHPHVLQTLVQDGYQFKALKRVNVVTGDVDALRLLLPGVDIQEMGVIY